MKRRAYRGWRRRPPRSAGTTVANRWNGRFAGPASRENRHAGCSLVGICLGVGRRTDSAEKCLAPVFCRSDVAASAGAFIDGLLSGISRKTGSQMAEQAGLSRPYRMQSLLGRSSWDAEALRDRVRRKLLRRSMIRPACWLWTRPDSSRRANTRSAWRGNIPNGSQVGDSKPVCSGLCKPAGSARR